MKKTTAFQKLLYLCAALFIAVVIAAYTSFLLGSKYFALPSNVSNENIFVAALASWALFSANLLLCILISTGIPFKKSFIYVLAYTPIWLISNFVFPAKMMIGTVILPIFYTIIVGLKSRLSFKRLFFWLGIISAGCIAYAILIAPVKLVVLDSYNLCTIPVRSRILWQLDYMALFLLIYLFKARRDNHAISMVLEAIFADDRRTARQSAHDEQAIAQYRQLKRAQKVRVILTVAAIQIVQLLIISSVCFLGNVIIEASLIFITFYLARLIIKKCWDGNSMLACTIATTLIFYGAAKVSIPFNKSLFVPILVGFAVAISLYYVAIHFDKHDVYKKYQEDAKSFDLKGKTVSREQLIERFHLCGIKMDDLDFCLSAFVDGKSGKELAVMYGYEYESARKKKERLRKKLMNYSPTQSVTN